MNTLPPLLANITWDVTVLAIAFLFVCVFMMLIILIQKPKGGGLSGAFGGAGGGESSFVGAKVGDVLTIVTVVFFLLFLGLAMALTYRINPTENLAKTSAVTDSTTTTTTAGGDAGETGEPAADGEDAAPMETPATEVENKTLGEEVGDAAMEALERSAPPITDDAPDPTAIPASDLNAPPAE